MEMDENTAGGPVRISRWALISSVALPWGMALSPCGREIPDPNDWATTYAGHFMLEAEARGYALRPVLSRHG